ncbi:hypothetical protein LCGC14_0018780 [marine sediment metagenome]|uniref:Transglutaminase-like domain-containing protein n=1 Tax=marine sediment metagenome TaxID=412755 RepID=A0A0F9YGN8_9ZZZZ|nr:DUF3857 domain-containing protein [Phycisphaerae bacterium]HDZ44910.1 DUF3857 domain-containing protein [Phycisphaerae bacterium]
MKHARNILVLSLILLTAVPACAQDYTKGILDRDTVIEAAKSVTTEAYPNADMVVVDGHVIVQYNADGTSTRWDDTVIKALTEKGKRSSQENGLYFTIPYDTVKLTLLEIIKPDGQVDPINITMNSRIMVDPSQMAMNIYNPNRKVLGFRVPGLEIGDMVRYVYRRQTVKTRMPDAWYDYELAQYTFPIKHFVYEVLGPKELPLKKIIVKDEVAGTIEHTTGEKDGLLHNRWEVSDVPRVFSEPSMPPLSRVVQRVRASTIPDWQTVSRWYWNLCEPHIKTTTPEMAEMVAELTKGLTDRQAKIEAIFRWASQKVRYMGITTETEAPGYEPHDASITFENKYGVCRDKAALLTAMLRLAGLDANVALIHADIKKDREAPDSFFNHAVVAVREADGSWQLMDCTPAITKQLLPSYLCDRSYLVASEAGDDLATSPIIPAEENLVHIETTGAISEAGDLTLQSVLRFEGINDNNYRGYFSRIKPAERRQFFERVAKSIVAGATLTRLSIEPADMQDTSQPLTVRMDITAPDVLVSSDRCSTMQPPLVGTSVGMVNFILRSTGLDKRTYPMTTDMACGVRETLRITLPDSLGQAVMPTFTPIDDPTLTWNRSLRIDDGQLVGTNEFLINVVEFSPTQYLQLKEHLRTIEYNERKMPIFAGPASPSPATDLVGPDDDYVTLDRRRIYTLKDARNWTLTASMTKKILTHAGKTESAELKFSYNPAWEDVKLVKATVTAPDGTVKEVRKEEINLMDAEWVAMAKRYPAGKTLVVNLPNVEIGSIIHYEVKRTYRDRPFFWMGEIFADFNPIVSKVVQIHAPTDLPLTVHSVAAEALTATKRTEGATTIYEWSIANQPGLKQERMVPPLWSFAPTVNASVGEWSAYANEIDTVFEAAAGKSKVAAAKARELVEDLDGDDAKVIAIRDFVAKTIRTLGFSVYFEPSIDELPLTTITPADRVLADGYGNPTDRAVLLTAMLRAAGFKPELVLAISIPDVHGIHNMLTQCPQTDSFTVALVRVTSEGREVYLNDSDQYGALGATGYDRGLGLTVATAQFRPIAAAPDRRELTELTYNIRLSAEGDATILRGRRWRGDTFGIVNRMYAEMTPEERRRSHQESISRISQSATANGELVTDFTQYPAIGKLPVVATKYAVRDGDHLYLKLPTDLCSLSLPGTDKRANDVYWSSPNRQTGRVTIELPEGFTDVLLAPPDIDWQAPAGAGHVRVRVTQEANPPRLVIDYDVDLKAAVIPASEYDKLLEIGRRLSHPSARTIVLRKSKP